MSESETAPKKYEYKGKFGVVTQVAIPPEEPTHEDVDDFVRSILGLKTDQRRHK